MNESDPVAMEREVLDAIRKRVPLNFPYWREECARLVQILIDQHARIKELETAPAQIFHNCDEAADLVSGLRERIKTLESALSAAAEELRLSAAGIRDSAHPASPTSEGSAR